MTKKKSKTHQSSNAAANADSSDSNDVNDKAAASSDCHHVAKSVDPTQVVKSLKNAEDLKKNFCPVCVKDSKPLKGNDIYVCLKCGTKTCCKEHSQAHFSAPRSDLHALAYDVNAQIVWCFGCSCEIDEKDVQIRKLSVCISNVNRQMSSAQKAKYINIKLPDANDDKGDSKEPTNKAQGFSKNGKKGGKPGITSPSMLSLAPVRGLTNLGNTCYFNSVMQCLARTQAFLSELKEMERETDVRLELKGGETLKGSLLKWDQMSECLHETLSSLLTSGSAYNPTKFLNFVRKKHPQFEGHDQHDAHELLRHTLDSIKMNDLRRYQRIMLDQKGLLKTDPKAVPKEVHKQMKELEHKVTQVQTFIPEKTFKGRLVSRVECQECHHSSEYIEGFLDLSLPILADKPHPPVGRRKGGNLQEDLSVDAPEIQAGSRVMSKKQMRQLKKRGLKTSGYVPPSRAGNDESVDEVAAEAQEALEAEEEVPRGVDEEKPHESGYSSEKASSSLRGSPSSEEVRSSSPCDDSWSALPQFTDSWLSALKDGTQLPVYVKNSPNLVNRPPTKIHLLPDGTPDLTALSLHDSVGSTLNRLCQDTQTIINQEPDWRCRIHQGPSRWTLSFESGNSMEDMKQYDDSSLVKSSELGYGDCTLAIETHKDRMVTPNWGGRCASDDSNDPPAESAAENTDIPSSQTGEGLGKAGDQGRSLTPPLRKMRTCQLKRDPDFSPLKEEESDAQLEVLSPIEDVADTIPARNPSAAGNHDVLGGGFTGSPVEVEITETDVTKTNDNKEALSYGSCMENALTESVVFDPWSSFRESFKDSKAGASTLRIDNDAERNFQTAPNNSLDSESNDSGEEKLIKSNGLPTGEFFLEDLPVESPVNHPLPSPGNSVNGEALQTSLEQKSRCSDEGDFEPLLGNLTESPKFPCEPAKHIAKEALVESFHKNTQSKIPCLIKKKDDRDNRDTCECSVESCLRQFTSIEFMTGSNKVGCSACTERQNKGAKDGKTVLTMATKQLLIGQAPPVLILHLKRFQVQLHSVRKLAKHVSFPLVLDLAPFCTSIGEENKPSCDHPMLYHLYGIVEHRGSLHSGHYVAYVKVEDADKRRWFCISDSHIDEVTEERVLKTEAYLLFYSKSPLPSSSP